MSACDELRSARLGGESWPGAAEHLSSCGACREVVVALDAIRADLADVPPIPSGLDAAVLRRVRPVLRAHELSERHPAGVELRGVGRPPVGRGRLRVGGMLSAVLLPVTLAVHLAAIRSVHQLAAAWMPDALSLLVTGGFAAFVLGLAGLTIVAIPLILENQRAIRPRRA